VDPEKSSVKNLFPKKKKKIDHLSPHPSALQHFENKNDAKSISSDHNNIDDWEDTAFHYTPTKVQIFNSTLFVLEFNV
jgi:hypothetical protein